MDMRHADEFELVSLSVSRNPFCLKASEEMLHRAIDAPNSSHNDSYIVEFDGATAIAGVWHWYNGSFGLNGTSILQADLWIQRHD